MSEYTTVIFDLDGVLIEHDFTNECKNICKILGIPYDNNLEEEYYNFWNNFNDIFKNIRMTRDSFMEKFEEHVEYFKLYGIYGNAFFNAFNDNDTVVKRHNYASLLETLSNRGLKIVALSDWFYKVQTQILKKLGYLEYFDSIYTLDGWYTKPDIRAIQRIIAGKDPKNYIFIGDSLVSDIACANASGVKSIWYNMNGKKNDTKYVPDYEVNNLEHILEIIK